MALSWPSGKCRLEFEMPGTQKRKPAQVDVYRFKDKDGKWRQEELPAQPIRELPPREKPKRKPA